MALKAWTRQDSPNWYIKGTVRVGERSLQICESTGIPYAGKQSRPPKIVTDLIRKRTEEIEAELAYGKSSVATFSDAAILYLKAGGSPRFLDRLTDKFGSVRLVDIDQHFLDEQCRELYGDCTAETRNRQFYTPFIAVWKHNSKGQNPLCPIVEWKRPAPSKKRKSQFSKAVSYKTAATFINALSVPAARVMFFLFWTGMRPNEAFRLTCDDIMLDDRWIILNQTKTDNPRGLPIHEALVPFLQSRIENGGHVFRTKRGTPWRDTRQYNREGRVINTHGGQMRTATLTAQKNTGLKITPYTARHTVSTYLIYPGGVEKVIKDQILGHAQSGDVSLDYIHLPQKSMQEAINRLPSPELVGVDVVRLISPIKKSALQAVQNQYSDF